MYYIVKGYLVKNDYEKYIFESYYLFFVIFIKPEPTSFTRRILSLATIIELLTLRLEDLSYLLTKPLGESVYSVVKIHLTRATQDYW